MTASLRIALAVEGSAPVIKYWQWPDGGADP